MPRAALLEIKEAALAAGLVNPDWVSPHVLRYAFATHMHLVFGTGESWCMFDPCRGDARWQQVFMAQPVRRRAFEPNSKWRKLRPAPRPSNTT
jgi:hypothetical protein